MKINDLEQILEVLKNSDITEFELDQDGTHLKVLRGPRQVFSAVQPVTHTVVEPAVVVNSAPHSAPAQIHTSNGTAATVPSNFVKVESPIVGTFYRKPSPDADPFVKEGDRVKKGDTLCIIEAMKLMNEIDSPCDGKVEKVFLTDGKVVEFGEALFYINPSA